MKGERMGKMFCIVCSKFSSESDKNENNYLWICPKCMEDLSGEKLKYYFGIIESQSIF